VVESTEGHSSVPYFTPISARVGYGALKTEKCYAVSEYKRPTGVYAVDNIYKISRICGRLHDGLGVRIWRIRPRDCEVIGV